MWTFRAFLFNQSVSGRAINYRICSAHKATIINKCAETIQSAIDENIKTYAEDCEIDRLGATRCKEVIERLKNHSMIAATGCLYNNEKYILKINNDHWVEFIVTKMEVI